MSITSSDNTAAEPKPLFRMPLDLRWSDCDAFNHVNNARYLTYLEEARIRWFAARGVPLITKDHYPVVVQSLLNYKMPITYPSDVVVELFLEREGNTSVTVAHRIASSDGSKLYCDGNVVVVILDGKTHRPIKLPDGFRKALQG